MPTNPNKLSQFWQELKRRKVVHVVTVYASAAFVMIELINNLAEPLNLPPHFITVVVIVLAVGFPLTIILSWLYDVTSEGVEKTKPVEELEEGNKTVVTNAWKIATYVSFVVIIGLVTFNIVGGTKELHAGDIQSLVVLPFDNYTGIDEFEYYIAGMHSGLIGDLGKISALRVLSKTTSRFFKDVDMTIPDIASELGVDAVIEPSISCVGGDSVCVQIKLVSAFPEEQQLWVKDFRVAKSQILNFYNNVTKQISEEINVVLTPQEESLLVKSRTINPEAYDAYLKGQYYWEKVDRESMEKALDYFQLAIEIDPEWADPYAGLANAWGTFGTFFRVIPQSITLPKVYKYLDKALELDPNSAQAHYVKAINAVWTEFDWEQGEEEFLKSLELNPNDALCRMYYSHLLGILLRPDEARIQANLALELDPMKPLILVLFRNGFVEGDDQSEILRLQKVLSIDPNYALAKVRLINIHMNAAYANGDYEKWIEFWDKKVQKWNDEGKAAVLNAFHERGHIAAIEEMFRMNEKYGDDCFMTGTLKAERYIKLKKYDKAMDCLEKAYEKRDMDMTYIATDETIYDHLKDNPRYIELLKKMNLPLPNN